MSKRTLGTTLSQGSEIERMDEEMGSEELQNEVGIVGTSTRPHLNYTECTENYMENFFSNTKARCFFILKGLGEDK